MLPTLGVYLFKARDDKGLSMRAVARKANVSLSYMCELENNVKIPSEPVLTRICKALELDLEDANCRIGRFPEDIARKLCEPGARRLVRSVLGLKQA